jgi:transposase
MDYSTSGKVCSTYVARARARTKTRSTPPYYPTTYTTMRRSFGQEISGNRGRGAELTPQARTAIIAKLEAGCTHKELAQEFGCSRRTIRNTFNRWKNHNTTQSLPRKGRPEKLNRVEKRALIRAVRSDPKIEYELLQKTTHTTHVHRSTIYEVLKKKGLTKHRCMRRPKLTRARALLRLRFCREHRHFNFRRRTVKFSDKCSVQRNSRANSKWCFRYPNKK